MGQHHTAPSTTSAAFPRQRDAPLCNVDFRGTTARGRNWSPLEHKKTRFNSVCTRPQWPPRLVQPPKKSYVTPSDTFRLNPPLGHRKHFPTPASKEKTFTQHQPQHAHSGAPPSVRREPTRNTVSVGTSYPCHVLRVETPPSGNLQHNNRCVRPPERGCASPRQRFTQYTQTLQCSPHKKSGH